MAAKEITPNGMDQGDLVKAVASLANALVDLAADLDNDGGVTGTGYSAVVADYIEVGSNPTSIKSLE